jgi:hypothetical protein
MSFENQNDKESEPETGNARADKPAQGAESRIPPVPGSTEPNRPEPPDRNRTAPRRDWHDKATLIVQAVGVLFLIAYTTFAALQWCETKKAADAARDAARVATVTLKVTLRPRLMILAMSDMVSTINGILTPNLVDGKVRVNLTIPNYGPFPANNVKWFRYDAVSSIDQIRQLTYGAAANRMMQMIPPRQDNEGIGIVGSKVLTTAEIDGLKTNCG